jgi:hypothetical protein
MCSIPQNKNKYRHTSRMMRTLSIAPSSILLQCLNKSGLENDDCSALIERKFSALVIDGLYFSRLIEKDILLIRGNDILSHFDDVYAEVEDLLMWYPDTRVCIDGVIDISIKMGQMVFWNEILDTTLLSNWLDGIPANKIVLTYGPEAFK